MSDTNNKYVMVIKNLIVIGMVSWMVIAAVIQVIIPSMRGNCETQKL